jgi:hypothetical protein
MHLEAKLGEILDALQVSGAGAVSLGAPTQASARSSARFVAGATAFHRSNCRLVEGRDDLAPITKAAALAQALKPCRICKPA